jgi:hypothetical protein
VCPLLEYDLCVCVPLLQMRTAAQKENKGGMVKHLQEEARGCDVLVLWLDCDRVRGDVADGRQWQWQWQ